MTAQLTRPTKVCASLQLGFFTIVGLPMFKAVADVFEGARPMLENVMGNYRMWEAAAADVAPAPSPMPS